MSPLSEKEALELEIARLSGAITNHGTGPSARPARGRPSNHPYKNSQPIKRGNKTLVIAKNIGNAQAGPSRLTPVERPGSGPPSAGPSGTTTPITADGPNGGWVKGTTKSGNKTLTNVDVHLKAEKARQVRDAQPKPPKPRRLPRHLLNNYGSVETRTPGGSGSKTVVIDGVVFQFDKDGQKLTRMGDVPSTPTATTSAQSFAGPAFGTPTRSSLSMSGRQYIRTKNGNMISAEVVRNRKTLFGGAAVRSDTGKGKEKIDKPCKYFTKTGQCQRASTCPYTHDPKRLAICSRFLRGNCPLDATTCPVSHTPSSHNAPSCSHYQMNGYCKNGTDCPYPHVKISTDAPVCQAFAIEGWCEKGDNCEEKHAWECREFNEKGQCSKQGKCALAHVLRAKSGVQQRALQALEPVHVNTDTEDNLTDRTEAGAVEQPGRMSSANDIAEQQDFIQFLSGPEDATDSGNDNDASEESSVSSDNDATSDDTQDEDDDEEDDEDVAMII